ncbi:MAG: alginate export family protein [Bacteroidales bacterium]|nr:alginate export family protein [Bacteroidales bacterium]
MKRLSLTKGRSTFTISGNYRVRGEFQGNYNVKAYGTEDHELFLISRLRFDMEYRYADWLKLFAEIQDAREWGSSFSDNDFQDKNNPYHDPFDINKLYISLKPIDSLEVILGRQALNLAGRRVFGPGDWGNTGRYIWDAANLIYSTKYFRTQMILGYNILHEPDQWPNMYKEGPYALAFYNTIHKLPFGLQVFYIYKWDEKNEPGHLYLNYFGARFQKKLKSFNMMALGAWQTGSVAGDKSNAFGVVLQSGYQFTSCMKPEIILIYIYGSGDKDSDDGIAQTFDGIFSGADTDLYSWMNFAFWKNIHQLRADLVLNFTPDISFRSEYHVYFLDQLKDAWYFPGKAMRRDDTGLSGKFIGQEVDLTMRAKIFYCLEALGGYCFFIPGEFARNTGAHPNAEWAFLQLTFMY